MVLASAGRLCWRGLDTNRVLERRYVWPRVVSMGDRLETLRQVTAKVTVSDELQSNAKAVSGYRPRRGPKVGARLSPRSAAVLRGEVDSLPFAPLSARALVAIIDTALANHEPHGETDCLTELRGLATADASPIAILTACEALPLEGVRLLSRTRGALCSQGDVFSTHLWKMAPEASIELARRAAAHRVGALGTANGFPTQTHPSFDDATDRPAT